MTCREINTPNGYWYRGEHTYILPVQNTINLQMTEAQLNNCRNTLENNQGQIVHIGSRDQCLGNYGGWFKNINNDENVGACYVLVAIGHHVNGNNYLHDWHLDGMRGWEGNLPTRDINLLYADQDWPLHWNNEL